MPLSLLVQAEVLAAVPSVDSVEMVDTGVGEKPGSGALIHNCLSKDGMMLSLELMYQGSKAVATV